MKTRDNNNPIYGPYKAGDVIALRTVTMHHIGRLSAVYEVPGGVLLEFSEGGWLADSKRWSITMKTGEVNEFEREPGTFHVWTQGGIDARLWPHKIPETC